MRIENKFVCGLRVTDRDTRDVTGGLVLGGLLNKLPAKPPISSAGQPAVGICASDAGVLTSPSPWDA